jgi:protein dithiol oxidoreductase (disulfide-forming)
MRRFVLALATFALAASFGAASLANADDGRWVAGQHYRVLNPAQPTNVPPGKVEVLDVFWYGCGGCFSMHPYMAAWKEKKPDAAEYVQLPAALNPGWQPQARLYFATKALGLTDQTHSAIFREMHVNRNPLNTLEQQIAFLGGFGVSATDARAALTSFGVDAELRAADVRARRYRLSFVPAFVVNGKYVIGVEQAGNPEAVLELINYLVAKEAAPTS